MEACSSIQQPSMSASVDNFAPRTITGSKKKDTQTPHSGMVAIAFCNDIFIVIIYNLYNPMQYVMLVEWEFFMIKAAFWEYYTRDTDDDRKRQVPLVLDGMGSFG